MTRLPILTLCLILSGAPAAQTQPLDLRARPVTGDSQKLLRGHAEMEMHGEWWQLTASLTDRDGRPWALEWTLHHRQPGSRGAGNKQPSGGMSLAHASITTPDGKYHEQNFSSRAIAATDGAALSDNANRVGSEQGWEWVSQGETLLPARLSFTVGERDINLLLEATGAGEYPDSAATDSPASLPSVRVRGFVDRGASKTYLRGFGRLDRESNRSALTGKPVAVSQPVTRKISSSSE